MNTLRNAFGPLLFLLLLMPRLGQGQANVYSVAQVNQRLATLQTQIASLSATQTATTASLTGIAQEATLEQVRLNTNYGNTLRSEGNTVLSEIEAKLPNLTGGRLPVEVMFPATQAVSGTVTVGNSPDSTNSRTTLWAFQRGAWWMSVDTTLSARQETYTRQRGNWNVSVLNPYAVQAADSAKYRAEQYVRQRGVWAVGITNFPATQAVTGTFWQTTQPISAASLPLPTGAATDAGQTTGNTSLASIDAKLTGNSLDRTTAAAPSATRLTDGSSFYDSRNIRALTSSDVVTFANTGIGITGSLPTGTNSIGMVGLSAGSNAIGSITNTAFALNAGINDIGNTYLKTLPKGATAAGSPTSTAASANRQPLDVTLYDAAGASVVPLSEATFLARTNTLDQKATSGSHPVVLPSDMTTDAQVVYRALTATGSPAATPGDYIVMLIRRNGGTTSSVNWFNATTGAYFTAAPAVANLTIGPLFRQLYATIPGTITTANVSQIAIAANQLRTGVEIINTSSSAIYVEIGIGAATSASIPLLTNGSSYRLPDGAATSTVSVVSAIAGATYRVNTY
jgi:uncharacterized small protein (DUF1192 family)